MANTKQTSVPLAVKASNAWRKSRDLGNNVLDSGLEDIVFGLAKWSAKSSAWLSNKLSPALPILAGTAYLANEAVWNFPDYGPEGVTSTAAAAAVAAAGSAAAVWTHKRRKPVAEWFNRRRKLFRSTAAYMLLAGNIYGAMTLPVSLEGVGIRYAYQPGNTANRTEWANYDKYKSLVRNTIAKRHNNLSPGKKDILRYLAKGVITAESSWDPNARNKKSSAIGLMQLLKGTAKQMHVNPSIPWQNVKGGTKYLRKCLEMNNWDRRKALNAYKNGPRDRWISPDKNDYKHFMNCIRYADRIKNNSTPWKR